MLYLNSNITSKLFYAPSGSELPRITRTATDLISTSNHMFGRATWNKLPKYIFEDFEVAQIKRGQFQSFQKSRG